MNVTLRPDRSLLDPYFESYKLSLHKIPVYEAKVEFKVNYKPLEEVISKQHLKAYNNINCLHVNPFNPNYIYYINSNGSVVSVNIPQCPQNFNQGTVVFTIPNWHNISTNEKYFNVSIQFPAPSYILLYDGLGNLYLLKSHVSYSEDSFTVVSNIQPPVHEKHSQLIDCVIIPDDTSNQLCLHCLFVCVSKKYELDFISDDSTSAYMTYLDWISFSSPVCNLSWSLVRHQKLGASSFPEFAALEDGASAIHICSERIFQVIYDSNDSSCCKTDLNKSNESKAMDTEDASVLQDTRFTVTWIQNDADEDTDSDLFSVAFTLNNIKLPSLYDRNTVLVQITAGDQSDHQVLHVKLCSHVSVGAENVSNDPITLIDHTLYAPVKPTSSWTYDRNSNCIEIHMIKQNTHYWPRLLLDSREDDKLIKVQKSQLPVLEDRPDVEADITSKPPFNVGQLEEVDFPMSEDDTDLVLQRIDHEPLKCTHKVHLSGHQWLFKVRCVSGSKSTQAFCIRHDVDGIVWLPLCQSVSMTTNPYKDQCIWKHVSTLQAFGYVLASKRECRFVSSPVLVNKTPLKFVAVADSARRIYVYLQPLPSDIKDTELRKRIATDSSSIEQKIVHVAAQYVISLPTSEPIIGFVAIDKPYASCIACTQSTLYILPIDG
ncbi:unnamed protein product [Heterobilharzia americana]|nr:unnamed protein product [Heterobilharzia americana]